MFFSFLLSGKVAKNKNEKSSPFGLLSILVAETGFEPRDLRVMRSYIDLGSVIDVLDRTGVTIVKPSVPPYGVSKKRKVKIHFNQ